MRFRRALVFVMLADAIHRSFLVAALRGTVKNHQGADQFLPAISKMGGFFFLNQQRSARGQPTLLAIRLDDSACDSFLEELDRLR